MTTLREAAQQALEALESLQGGCTDSNDGTVEAITVWCPEVIDALRAALAQEEQEHHWLTKLLMADYLDMIAEAIENHSSETLRHKAHWMRTRGEV